MKGHDMPTDWRYSPKGQHYGTYQALNNAPIRYMLAHSGGVEYAKTIEALDFSLIDPFSVWSVHADYSKHQVCIGLASPVSLCDSDAVYAVGANSDGQCHYVNGTVFLPGVIRNRLVDLSDCGEFAAYNWRLPCVTAKPVVSADGLATLSEPA
jgi:hypothetical protein